MDRQLFTRFGFGFGLTCTSLLLSACGGGGSGGDGPSSPPGATITGNGFAPSTGPGDVSGYLPVAAGNQWLFNYTTTDPNATMPFGIVAAAINGTKSVQGATATVVTFTNPTAKSGGYDQYFGISNGGIAALGNTNPADTISPLIVPYVDLVFPVQLGQTSLVTGTNLADGKDVKGNPITLNLTQTITNVDFETIDVPAGTFANALRQTTTITATVLDNGQTAPISGNETTWYVPGVGEVKDESIASGGGKNISSGSELRGYVVNGQHYGLGATEDVNASLTTANCAGYAPPAIASDGANFLIVASTCSIGSGTPVTNWVATIVRSDGSVVQSLNLESPTPNRNLSDIKAAAAWDGNNYLVVYVATDSPLGQANLVAALVSPTGMLVSPPSQIVTGFIQGETGGHYTPSDGLALAFNGSEYLLAFPASNGVTGPIEGVFISPVTGQANGAPLIIHLGLANQNSTALSSDGKSNFLAVWFDSGTAQLEAARVAANGTVLDGIPIIIVDASHLQAVDYDFQPAVSFDGTNFLVAYRDLRSGSLADASLASISAARISTAGALLDGSATVPGITVTKTPLVPNGHIRSAFLNGAHWLVWESGSPQQLSAARVSTSGTVSSAWADGFTVVPATDLTEWPALAAAANGGFLTWIHAQQIPSKASALEGLPIFPVLH